MTLHQISLLEKLSEFYKLFADTTRLRILDTLLNGELKVGDIATTLNLSQSLISHQLKYLKSANFVKARREGKTIFYAIADEHIQIILEYGLAHIGEKLYEKDEN